MRFFRFFALIVTIFAPATLAQPETRAAPAAQAARQAAFNPADPLPTDPRLVTGEFENGMRYILVRHANPPERATVWLHVRSGSLHETEPQRGIAHFLEHMAFNGSENFPPGAVIPFFESLGLTFGLHQNAHTGFDETVYKLRLPDTEPETIRNGLTFFADVASRLSLLPEEIEDERQIILEEKRTRGSGRQRVSEFILEHIAPGSLFGRRLPIGTEETIRSVSREDFLEFYGRCYVPSNMVLIVVADAEPGPIVELASEMLGAAEPRRAPARPDSGVRENAAHRGIVATDPEIRDAEVSINRVAPPLGPTTTAGDLRRELVERIGTWTFNRRVRARVDAGEASFHRGSAGVTNFANAVRWTMVSAAGEPEDWRGMLAEISVELQRARLHGFTDREIEDARAELLAQAREDVRQEPTVNANALINAINRSVAAGEPFMSAAQRLELLEAILPTVTAAEVSARFAEVFEPRHATFILQAPADAEGLPSESELVALGVEAVGVEPEASGDRERAEAFMDARPAPAAVVELNQHAPSGVWSLWLENGARVNYRFMDYKRGSVSVTVTLAGGPVAETAENRGVSDAAALAWGASKATARLSPTAIRDLLTGKNVSVSGQSLTDVMRLRISGTPEDLEEGLQLAHLLLTEPRVDAAAFEKWRQRVRQSIDLRGMDPMMAFLEVVYSAVYPDGEVRGMPITHEQLDRLTPAGAQAWLERVIRVAPIEVSIVGDIGQEEAFDLARRYIGTLPARERIGPETNLALRTLERPESPRVVRTRIPTRTPTAMVMAAFYGVEGNDAHGRRLMRIAEQIISTRMVRRIREEQQLAYSPSVSSSPAQAWPGFGLFMAYSSTEPSKADVLAAEIDAMFAEFADRGPSEEEVATAKGQIANALAERMLEPSFWTAQLSDLGYRGTDLDEVLADEAAYEEVGAEEVRAAFAALYRASKIVAISQPEESAGAAAGE